MKAKIIPCCISLIVIAVLAVIFVHQNNNSQSDDKNDSEPVILRKIQTDYMDLNGEIWITEDSIQFNAVNIKGHDTADYAKAETLTVYYKDGSSLEWTQDAYSIEGNHKKSALFYSWVCSETNKNSIDDIDHIKLGDSTIQIN
ncbi:MAG: hypothetical protein K6F71_08540 [Ruminococcus sp.]|uniref:hypothetical protein n=1 Tax=Ruminococcus sp. TaxID=41978 RepID=UPI0025D59D1A|nr:hypothetical protein [Ruminococcus sp.]MCR5540846.1 hypothetical protein [Ruminococcus sp.]